MRPEARTPSRPAAVSSSTPLTMVAQLERNKQRLEATVASLRQGQQSPAATGTTAQIVPPPPKKTFVFDDPDAFNRAARNPEPNAIYRFSSYAWETDDRGRVAKVDGRINLKKHGRQTTDGVTTVSIGQSEDALPGDVGFHLIGDQFDGPINNLNVVAGNGVSLGQLKALNLSGYKRWENKIAKLARQGTVTVRIKAVYSSGNHKTRPDVITAEYQDNEGRWVKSVFRNKAGG